MDYYSERRPLSDRPPPTSAPLVLHVWTPDDPVWKPFTKQGGISLTVTKAIPLFVPAVPIGGVARPLSKRAREAIEQRPLKQLEREHYSATEKKSKGLLVMFAGLHMGEEFFQIYPPGDASNTFCERMGFRGNIRRGVQSSLRKYLGGSHESWQALINLTDRRVNGVTRDVGLGGVSLIIPKACSYKPWYRQ